MPIGLLPAALMSGGSFLSSIFGGQRNSQTRSAQTPAAFHGLESLLLRNINNRLRNPGLPEGFEEQGIGAINNTFGGIGRTIGNSLISRGLSASPMAGASDRNLNFARGGEISRFRTGLPALEREFQNQDLNLGMNLFRSRFPDQTTTGSVGGGVGEGIGGMSSMLAFLYGMGAFGGDNQTPLTSTLVR